MEIVGIIAAVVVVVGLVWFFLLRPSGEDAALPPSRKPDAKPTKAAAEPEKPAEEQRQAPPKPEQDAPRAADKPATEGAADPQDVETRAEPRDADEEPAPPAEAAAQAAKIAAEPAITGPEDEEPSEEPREDPKEEPSEEDVEAVRGGLGKTRGGFIARIAGLFRKKKKIDPELLDELLEVLITADVGANTSERILAQLRERMNNAELDDEDRVWAALREEGRTILQQGQRRMRLSDSPSLILVVGVNGVGKTTTIGKLASRFEEEGKQVILAAGDTFRAAAVPQLEVWGRRVGCPVVKGKRNADPGSVIFDAIRRAQEENADVVLADTAGRLHTKSNLMEELKKVVRSSEKALGRPIDEILLVLDSTTGQNAISQAALFKEAIDVSGIALTKLDGTAKGGVILGIVDEHGLPVHYIGVGERVEDLREFDAATFVEALFSKPDESADT